MSKLLPLLCLFLFGPAMAAESGVPAAHQMLKLNADEVAHLRAEMRGFLASVQKLTAALAANDMPGVAAAARASGVAAAHQVPAGLRGKLPAEFKRWGQATHSCTPIHGHWWRMVIPQIPQSSNRG